MTKRTVLHRGALAWCLAPAIALAGLLWLTATARSAEDRGPPPGPKGKPHHAVPLDAPEAKPEKPAAPERHARQRDPEVRRGEGRRGKDAPPALDAKPKPPFGPEGMREKMPFPGVRAKGKPPFGPEGMAEKGLPPGPRVRPIPPFGPEGMAEKGPPAGPRAKPPMAYPAYPGRGPKALAAKGPLPGPRVKPQLPAPDALQARLDRLEAKVNEILEHLRHLELHLGVHPRGPREGMEKRRGPARPEMGAPGRPGRDRRGPGPEARRPRGPRPEMGPLGPSERDRRGPGPDMGGPFPPRPEMGPPGPPPWVHHGPASEMRRPFPPRPDAGPRGPQHERRGPPPRDDED